MFRRVRSRLSYANVVATMALFIALGGVSYAAVVLPANSVGTKQIKANAVTGAKVKNKSLTAADFNGSVQGPAGPAGAQGAPGAPGKDATAAAIADGSLAGAKLVAGAVKAGQLGAITVREQSITLAAGEGGSAEVSCTTGERLLGGGADSPVPTPGEWVAYGSYPLGNGWKARAVNTSAGNEGFTVYALCLEVG